jgi:hypothetical protein
VNEGLWSAGHFAQIEAALWPENPDMPVDLSWLEASWQDPKVFFKALHAYAERRQGSPSKSTPWLRYDFYHDLIVRHKDQNQAAFIWFDKEQWHQWTYAELGKIVNGLAATWENLGVQAGETLLVLYPMGPEWLSTVLAGLRLGMVISIVPPQGNAFVKRRLDNIAPNWLAADPLYRYQLPAAWQDLCLPYTLSSDFPARRAHEYAGTESVALCLDPTSPSIDLPQAVEADSLYLGAMRDGIFSLGIKPGQTCAAPGWHTVESQPALIFSVLLS